MEGPRGAEPMGVGAGPEGGNTPPCRPRPLPPFSRGPDRADPDWLLQHLLWLCRCSFPFVRTSSPTKMSEPLLPSTKMRWES